MDHEVALGLFEFGNFEEIQEGYSGRGMYGKETTALVYDNLNELLVAIVDYAESLTNDGGAFNELRKAMSHAKMDNMGMSYVVY